MKHVLLLAGMMAAGLVALAQCSIQPILPSAGLVQKTQLWNVLVVNSSTTTLNCRLTLNLRDRESGQDVLTASTGLFTIAKEAKQLNAATLMPIQYNQLTGNAMNDFLPIGNYTACYKLSAADDKSVFGEECVSFDVQPLTPPMLNMPADSAVLSVQPSQFTWLPPTPTAMFNHLQYQVLITEILPGQKAEEAIQLNMPFYTDYYKTDNILTYPAVSASFEKDKWYAWQVVARDDNSYAAKSEVWVFSVSSTAAPTATPFSGNYIALQKHNSNTGTYVINGQLIGVQYYSYDSTHKGDIIIRDANGKVMKQANENIAYGDNYFYYTISSAFKKNEVYTIELIDKKGSRYTASFSIQ